MDNHVVRRRPKRAIKDEKYNPLRDTELKKIAVETNVEVQREKEKKDSQAGFSGAISRFIMNSKIFLYFTQVDILTGYKPFNLFKHLYHAHSTGLSFAYLIANIVVVLATIYYALQRYQYAQKRQMSISANIDSSLGSLSLPSLIGVGFVAPTGYSGFAYANTSFYTCTSSYSTATLTESCNPLSTVKCGTISDAGLSTAELNQATALGLDCPSTNHAISRSNDQTSQAYIKAEITIENSTSTADVQSLLTSGATFYLASSTYQSGSDRSKLADNSLHLATWPAGYHSVHASLRFGPVKHKTIERGAIDYVYSDTYLRFQGGLMSQGSYVTSANVAFTAIIHSGLYQTYVEEVMQIWVDIGILVAGVVFALFIIGWPIRIYNRWSYRREKTCCRCCFWGGCGNPFIGALFGNHGPQLNNISFNSYMQNFFTRSFDDSSAGSEMLDKVHKIYEGDTYDMTVEIDKTLDRLRNKMVAVLETKAKL